MTQEKTVKAWAIVEDLKTIRSGIGHMRTTTEILGKAGKMSIFRDVHHCELALRDKGERVVPCTITYKVGE
jgi:hypothetical protein